MSANSAAPRADCSHIGVVGQGFVDWGGGLDFLRLVLDGLTITQTEQPIVLLLPRPGLKSLVRDVGRFGWRMVQLVRRGHRPSLAGWRRPAADVEAYFADYADRIDILSYVDSRAGLARICQAESIVGLVPICGSVGRRFGVPWVGYIYDFQHRHLPAYFTAAERARRDSWFARVLADAPIIVANARAVQDDVAQFFPAYAHKVRVLPFAPRARKEWLSAPDIQVARRYGIRAGFFIVCNQFWLHKDHETAIRGFYSYLASTGDSDRVLVCTGEMTDAREPAYAARVRALVGALGLTDRIYFLGRIAKIDQMTLVRLADVLVQPTLFEGGPGGGASYDAIAVGTPVIASDIPVNLEMDCGDVRFFPAGDPTALASRLVDIVAEPPVRPSADTLLQQTNVRSVALGKTLRDAVRSAGAQPSPVVRID